MTAFGVGRGSDDEVIQSDGDNQLLTYVGKVLYWIPADAIAFYTAAVTALVADPKDDPKWWLVVVAVAVGIGLVVAGRLSKGVRSFLSWKLLVRIVLVVVAFLIWSPTVPKSGWQSFKVVSDNPGWTVVICAGAGILFAAFSDLLKTWVESP